MKMLVEKLGSQAGISAACRALAVPRSWYYRQQAERVAEALPATSSPRPTPAHALSGAEKEAVRSVLNSPRFMDLPPREVYAALLDEGEYLCHWRTMYRLLAEHDEVHERRNQRQHPSYPRPQLLASGPNQVWSWDISWLMGAERSLYYYLYVILDIFSRFVVGWMIAEEESGELAKAFIETTCRRQGIGAAQLTLHADRGSPMRAHGVSQLLELLGVTRSHSRPRTSNDNPYSEAQFKTMKYRPDYPQQFDSLAQARSWARDFFDWYNYEHYHVGLGLMTPAMVHTGQVAVVRRQRQQVLDAAYRRHPQRFAGGPPVAPQPPAVVWINPPLAAPDEAAAADAQRLPIVQTPSRVEVGTLQSGDLPAKQEMILCPVQEVITTVLLNGELSQTP